MDRRPAVFLLLLVLLLPGLTPPALGRDRVPGPPLRFPTPEAIGDPEADLPFCALPVDGVNQKGRAPNQLLAAAGPAPCVGGSAAGYPCSQVDLAALVPSTSLSPAGASGEALNGNDLWGWADPARSLEVALVGLRQGTAFVDVSTPTAPVVQAFLPSAVAGDQRSIWRDIKVYDDHAFIVSEMEGHGMQVVDLTRLPALVQVAAYHGFGRAHNLVIDEVSGYGYAVGSDTCAGGLHVVDLSEPTRPRAAGCFGDDFYTHDAQCVTYPADHPRYAGRQICFAFNVDTLTIMDVSDKGAMSILSRTGYDGNGYSHQGWLHPSLDTLYMDDEFDEWQQDAPTSTYLWDVRDLAAPRLVNRHIQTTRAIDHNLYTRGDRLFEANYQAGLRILDTTDPSTLVERGYFDVYPTDDDTQYNGAWSVYPYLPSGTLLVNGIEQGLFVLQPQAGAVVPDLDLTARDARFLLPPGARRRDFAIDSHALYGYGGSLTIEVAGLPPGVSATVSPPQPLAGQPFTLTLDGTAARPQSVVITLIARDGSLTRRLSRVLQITERAFLPAVLR